MNLKRAWSVVVVAWVGVAMAGCDSKGGDGERIAGSRGTQDAALQLAAFSCDCANEAQPGACDEADWQESLGDPDFACIDRVVASDRQAQQIVQCYTTAMYDVVECMQAAGCEALRPDRVPMATNAGPDDTTEPDEYEWEPSPCEAALIEQIERCGELPDAIEAQLEDECFPSTCTATSENGTMEIDCEDQVDSEPVAPTCDGEAC